MQFRSSKFTIIMWDITHFRDVIEEIMNREFPVRVYTKGMEMCLYSYNYFVFEFKM